MSERDEHDVQEGDYDDSAASSSADQEDAQAKVEDEGASQGGKGRPQ